MENPIKMDDFGVPLFLETPIWSLFKNTMKQLLYIPSQAVSYL